MYQSDVLEIVKAGGVDGQRIVCIVISTRYDDYIKTINLKWESRLTFFVVVLCFLNYLHVIGFLRPLRLIKHDMRLEFSGG